MRKLAAGILALTVLGSGWGLAYSEELADMLSGRTARTAPQEQASNLAVPDQRPLPKTVVAIVLCNAVTGLLIVDDTGEVHPTQFSSKEEVQHLQAMVPADHNFALNLGCPGNASKDTTVL